MAQGIEAAWVALEQLSREDVCRRADARFDPELNAYLLKCFGQEIGVYPGKREIKGESPVAVLLLGKLRYFFELAILRYLSGASAVPLSGLMVRPAELKGGRLFEGGSHVLPLEKIARKYGADVPGFLARGLELGGEK
ncbi:MAG: DUF3786 domain-containing protein, partial [Lentisphaerae bacterium]|nr:DUF3786 domain-containing protein [Lentisphaerota bacterium]